ncbi:MAG TPA: Hpt domain-containing protein, partial [bacterium]|nr:Hpt domain-containing protein [bacterium]
MNAEERVEWIAEALLLVEPTDFQDLANVHTEFEKLIEWSKSVGRTDVLTLSSRSLSLIERVILQETDDPVGALEQVGKNLSAIQNLVRDIGGDDLRTSSGQSSDLSQNTTNQEDGESVSHPTGLPTHIDAQIFADFLARQGSVLERVEELVLVLEQGKGESVLAELRRIIHTLKGETKLLCLDEVQSLCHVTEDLLDSGCGSAAADRLLAVKDWLARAFDAYSGKGALPESVEELLKELTDLVARNEAERTSDADVGKSSSDAMGLALPAPETEQKEVVLEADPDLL